LDAVLIQPEYFPDSPSDLVSADGVADPLCGYDSNSGGGFASLR
jgi:hypothetical protein